MREENEHQTDGLQLKFLTSNIKDTKVFYTLIFGNPIYESETQLVFNYKTNQDSNVQLFYKENSETPTGSSTLLHVNNVTELWLKLKDKVKITTPLTEFTWGTYFGFKDNQNYSLGYYTKKESHPAETQFTESINDFKRSRNFYEKILNFECIEDWDRGEFDKGAIFKIGLNRFEIINRNRPNGIVPPKTGTIVCLKVENVWNEWKRLKNIVNVKYPLRESSKNYFSFGFYDVDGLLLEFFSIKK